MYQIDWTRKATKQLSKIASAERPKIVAAVGTLANFPDTQNVKALTGHQHAYRLRVGNYRVLFNADTDVHVIAVEEVKKRDGHTY